MRTGEGVRVIGPEDLARIERVLAGFLHDAAARCAVLMDRTGRLVAASGETGGLDGVSFASLAAADFAASDQLARLLGEEECESLFHQGERRSMYLADVDGHAVLAAIFDEATTLGMVRLRARDVLPELAAAFAAAIARGPRPDETLTRDWAAAAASEIDRLFSD